MQCGATTLVMSATTTNQDNLVSKLEERDECERVKCKGTELYVYIQNPDSSVKLYSSVLNIIERHNHKVKYVGFTNEWFDTQLRVKVVRQ